MNELIVSPALRIPLAEIEMRAVRSQGAGGQNVNKVASAIHLRFDIRNSPSLPDEVRRKLLASGDQRISADGVIVIKSQETRSQERNRQIALERLAEVIRPATQKAKKRVPTRPGKAAKTSSLSSVHHARIRSGESSAWQT